MNILGIGRTAVRRNVSYLRKNGFVERVGSNKKGYWKVLYKDRMRQEFCPCEKQIVDMARGK